MERKREKKAPMKMMRQPKWKATDAQIDPRTQVNVGRQQQQKMARNENLSPLSLAIFLRNQPRGIF